MSVELSSEELSQYSRHLLMSEFGIAAQKQLKSSRVLCVGTGGLGSPVALYLAAAGVGTLGILDYDLVETSNLQRQIVHGHSSVGKPKVESAIQRLRDLNQHITLIPYNLRLTHENALEIFSHYDVIVDGTDNFATRYLVNDACVLSKKICVYGSVLQFTGVATVFYPGQGPCYRCLYPDAPPAGLVPSCAEAGVLGILPGLIGVVQATEVIKAITGKGQLLVGRLLQYDALEMSFREFKFKKYDDCAVCGPNPSIVALSDYQRPCSRSQSENEVESVSDEITPLDLKAKLDAKVLLYILDVREPFEYEIAHIGGVLIPVSQILHRQAEIPKDRPVIVLCHHGVRSLKVIELLKSQGFSQLLNLQGGIDQWSEDVDPTLARY